MAKTENPNKDKLKNVLSQLEKNIEIKPKSEPQSAEIEQPQSTDIETETNNETVIESAEQTETPTTETTSEAGEAAETATPDEPMETKGTSTLFDMFNKPTEEDGKPDNLSRLEHIAETITDDDLKEDDLDLNEESPAVAKEMADVKATAWVEFGEIAISLLCMWIADDWSLDAQAKKFIISPPKKKAIKISIMRIILAKKKKTNPTVAIIFLCLGACLPMLFIAILTRIQKKRAHAEQMDIIAQQRRLIAEQNAAAAMQYEKTFNANTEALQSTVNNIVSPQQASTPMTIVKTKPTTEKRGRHKNGCAYYKGKPCNCKK